MKKGNVKKIIGYLLSAAILILGFVMAFSAKSVQMIPTKFIIVGCCFYLLLAVITGMLTKLTNKWGYLIITGLLFVVMLVLTIIFCHHMSLTKSKLAENMSVHVETTQISVYVDNQDKAQKIEDAKEYSFGILGELDRENTDKALKELNKVLGKNVTVVEYQDLAKLADGMIEGEVQAILLNEGYIPILEEWNSLNEEELMNLAEGNDYETFAKNLRILWQNNIEQKVEVAVPEETPKEDDSPDSFIMYISGQDAWGGIAARSRSDVNIIAVVNKETNKVMLISTPRDYYVPLSVSNGVKDKLTHAGIYGVDCSRDTLEMLYDINIDYYFKLNFSGFEAIIDALGGITVWSDYDFTVEPVKHYVKGDNYLTGIEALAFARERYALPGGDNARGRNQMNVIISVVDKLSSSALLKNYTEVLDSLDGTYETDVPYEVVAELLKKQIDSGTHWEIQSYAVTGTGGSEYTYSIGSQKAYVMFPDEASVAEAKRLIQDTLDGK